MLIDKLKVRSEVAIVKKPLFIKDMPAGTSPLDPSRAELDTFDRIIDVTGAERACLASQNYREKPAKD